ncbi:MAG: EipA family protein [Hyphomicrobiaceae bacterium]|nr:EipA family protein [Hyphomicrobiaceae bacterium]
MTNLSTLMRLIVKSLLVPSLLVAALVVSGPARAQEPPPWQLAQNSDRYEDRYDVYREVEPSQGRSNDGERREAAPYDPRYDGPPATEPERYERQPAAPPTYGAPYSDPDRSTGDQRYPAPQYDAPRGDGGRRYAGPEEPYYERREPESDYPRERYSDEPRNSGPATYEQGEIARAGHSFFGSVSKGLASAIEYTFKNVGRPNGYVLGEDAGGAIVAGLRFGEGTLYTRDAGEHRVYWQGPTIGYDFGAEGSKVMVLVYNLSDPADIYERFGGVQGAAYLIGGVSVQLQKHGNVTLALIRSGVGVRLGANVGYLKYTRSPTWNPF